MCASVTDLLMVAISSAVFGAVVTLIVVGALLQYASK
jgi:hypothetical protein